MRVTCWITLLLLTASTLSAADWSQLRGPNQNGTTDETNLPTSLDPNTLLWKTPLPGPGEATPAVCNGYVYLSGYNKDTKQLFASCFDAETGKQIWSNTASTFDELPRRDVIASPSPVADTDGAVFMYSNGTLVRYDRDGKEAWKRDLVAEYGPLKLGWSYSSSPFLYNGHLYVQVMRSSESPKDSDYTGSMASYLLAVDPKTGKNIFKMDRPTDAEGDFTDSYTTPVTAEINGQTQLILFGGNYLTGHELSTGKELWRYKYKDIDARWGRAVATPIVDGNMIYCFYPLGSKAFACDLSKLAASQTEHVWTYDQQTSDVSTPTLVNGYLYLIEDRSKVLTCLDAKTGTVQWTGQLDKNDTYYASISAGDGKLYAVNRKGVVTVVAADPKEFRILSTTDIGEDPVDSSIPIANGKLYLRTAENLYCFEKK